MLVDDTDLVDELLNKQPKSYGETDRDIQEPESAKEMQGPRLVLQKETNSHQIEQDSKSARDTIMRLAALPVDIVDRNLADRSAIG